MAFDRLTLTDLLTRLKARWEIVPYWTDVEATLYLNEALQCWGMLTGRWKRRVVVATVPNTHEVTLPAEMVFRMRLEFNGFPLSPTSLTDLNNGQANWRRETTVSGGNVPTRPTLWAPISLGIIIIWPADAVGNNALTVDGVSDTPLLVNPTDFVDLSEADVNLLLGYALHAASLKKGGPWFQATIPLFRAFLEAAGEENDLITTSQAYRQWMTPERDPLKTLKRGESSVDQLIQGTAAQ